MRKPRPTTVSHVTVCFDVRDGEKCIEIDGWAMLTLAQAKRFRDSLDKHIAYLQATNEKRRKRHD